MNPKDIMTDAIHNFHPQYQQYTQYSAGMYILYYDFSFLYMILVSSLCINVHNYLVYVCIYIYLFLSYQCHIYIYKLPSLRIAWQYVQNFDL